MRKICVFTGTRAEYGLLYWVMKRIQDDQSLQLQIIVTGAHLSEHLGATWKQIVDDGFVIDEKVPMDLKDDSSLGLIHAMGAELVGVSKALDRLMPDILVILGDRYEAFIAATSAMMLGVPIAHIHGGEITEGLIDEAIRHSITKMSHIHFPAADTYKKRIIQLGEKDNYVFNVGAPGLDHIANADFMSEKELSQSLEFDLSGNVALITYHPVTLSNEDPARGIHKLLSALDDFPNLKVVFTKANADRAGSVVNQAISTYVEQNKKHTILVSSLGQKRYLSLVDKSKVVIGNSSSGLIEAPVVGTPTINIGPRQAGRLRASSIIDCLEASVDISMAIKRALSPDFQKKAASKESPYGVGGASEKITGILKSIELEGILIKSFNDHYISSEDVQC